MLVKIMMVNSMGNMGSSVVVIIGIIPGAMFGGGVGDGGRGRGNGDGRERLIGKMQDDDKFRCAVNVEVQGLMINRYST